MKYHKPPTYKNCIIVRMARETGRDVSMAQIVQVKKFRDEIFQNSANGISVIENYYESSDTLVRHFETQAHKKELATELWAHIDSAVNAIETHRNEAALACLLTFFNESKRRLALTDSVESDSRQRFSA